jgi:hypothetical protein
MYFDNFDFTTFPKNLKIVEISKSEVYTTKIKFVLRSSFFGGASNDTKEQLVPLILSLDYQFPLQCHAESVNIFETSQYSHIHKLQIFPSQTCCQFVLMFI